MNKLIKIFLESNRYKHFICAIIISIFTFDSYNALYIGMIAASCLEFKDKAHGGKWDWIDWIFTVLGSLIVSIIYIII